MGNTIGDIIAVPLADDDRDNKIKGPSDRRGSDSLIGCSSG
jgi:hypothetical protein